MRAFIQKLAAITVLTVLTVSANAADSLVWRTNRVDAEIHSWSLAKVLQKISRETGWEVYLEPGTSYKPSVKFKDAIETDALKKLLGNLSFVLMPQTNSVRKLYVFHTTVGHATQRIRTKPKLPSDKPIPNQLILTFKRGKKVDIDALAKKLGATVVGSSDLLNAFLLEFPDAESADKARELLADQTDANVDLNYPVDTPDSPDASPVNHVPAFNLQANTDPNHTVVALIDTHVGALNGNMQSFMMTGINEAGDADMADDTPTHGDFMAEAILQALQEQNNCSGTSRVRILPIDVYGNNDSTTTFDVANGIAIGAAKGASIMNLSLGSAGDSTFLHQVIADLSRQHVTFIAAAGNTPTTSPTFPAAYQSVIAVTASDPNGKLASYANRGNFIDMMYPGTEFGVVGNSSYQVTGTSSATGFASGNLAGLMDCGGMTAQQAATYMALTHPFQGLR